MLKGGGFYDGLSYVWGHSYADIGGITLEKNMC
jgi:hypothetical protein